MKHRDSHRLEVAGRRGFLARAQCRARVCDPLIDRGVLKTLDRATKSAFERQVPELGHQVEFERGIDAADVGARLFE